MARFLQAVVTGGALGSLLAFLAFGMTLTYRTAGIFNFAQGAIGMLFAFTYFHLVQGGRLFLLIGRWDVAIEIPEVIALPLVVLVIAPAFGWLLDRILFRHLRSAETHVQIVSTIGLLIALQGLVGLVWSGAPTISPDPVFPSSVVTIGSFSTPQNTLWTIGVAIALAAALVAFLRYSRTGVRMRAVVDRTELAELVGLDSARLSALSWGLSTSFAALAGILAAPLISASLDLLSLPLLVIPATAAAVVGRLRSLPMVLVGGVIIGVGQTLSSAYAGATAGPILASTLPFLVLFAALLLPIDWREVRAEVAERRVAAVDALAGTSRRWKRGAFIGVFVIAILPSDVTLGWPSWLDFSPVDWIPNAINGTLGWFGQFQSAFSRVPGLAIVFLGLVVLVGYAGQISLAHAALAAVGAITASHLVVDAGVPFLLAALLGGLVAVVPGVLLAWRAVRLSPLFLGLATLAFAALMTQLMFNVGWLTNGLSGVRFERTAILQDPYAYYLGSLTLFFLAAVLVRNLRRGAAGLALQAMRDSETAIRGFGSSLGRLKLTVFSLSAFLAGFGGAIFVGAGEVAEPTNFVELFSLLFLALAVVGGIRYIRGALIGAGLLVLTREFLPVVTDWISRQITFVEFQNIDQLPTVLFGIAAIGLATNPGGIVEQARDGWIDFVERLARRRERRGGLDALEAIADGGSPTFEAMMGEPDVDAPTEEIALNGHRVTFPAATLFHRADCILGIGKTPQKVGARRLARLDPCPVCEPDAEAAGDEPVVVTTMTRAELYAIAQDLEIPGRSSMSKDDLAAAIDAHRG